MTEGTNPVAVIDSGTKSEPKHEFHDTKYHRVGYTPVAVTRFREYFPAATNTAAATTLPGADFTADVLNSARPAAPKVLYALPLFEWDTTPPGTPGSTGRPRVGGGLRIYLERPWYSSGDGELLGVVFLDGAEFLTLADPLKPLVTQWGADPIWGGQPAPASAAKTQFPERQAGPGRAGARTRIRSWSGRPAMNPSLIPIASSGAQTSGSIPATPTGRLYGWRSRASSPVG